MHELQGLPKEVITLNQRIERLNFIFNPESIAVVGASNTERKIGYIIMKNLITSDWGGEIYPVNPKAEEVQCLKAYPSVKDIPGEVDLAIIVVPALLVTAVMKECAEKSVKAGVIISSGFKETGPEGAKLEEKIANIATKTGIPIVGPNCFGIYNCNIDLNASIGIPIPPSDGHISFATQSGLYGNVLAMSAIDTGIKFSKILSYGNKCDVDDVDALSYFMRDPQTRIIAFFVESIARGRKFFELAKKVTKKKPVIITKIGRTSTASRAAMSHTGALTGSFAIFNAACKQSGIILARTGVELIDILKAINSQPLPKGNQVGIVSSSGGIAVELTDLCEENGFSVPELPQEIQARIKRMLSPFASARNPIDLTASGKFPELYYKCVIELLGCQMIDLVVVILGGRLASDRGVIASIKRGINECQEKKGIKKPVLVCWAATEEARKSMKVLETAHIPCYRGSEGVINAIRAMHSYSKYLRKQGSLDNRME